MDLTKTRLPDDAGAAAQDDPAALIERDVWVWLKTFVTVDNIFYAGKFAPCPYARAAILANQVDVKVYPSGNTRAFIREKTIEMRDSKKLSTRVIVLPPRVQWQWGISEYVEALNAEVIRDNVFLNTGVTKTMASRYPGSRADEFYFIVVANRWDAVLAGSKALERTDYYNNWPRDQYELVVQRRERMVERYRKKDGD